jgi:GNAT superfamily N-acetyltransferase
VPGSLRDAGPADRELVEAWLAAFAAEALGERLDGATLARLVDCWFAGPPRRLVLWQLDGAPVALAAASGPTPHGIRIGPVFTPPAERGHGYGSACVAALSQLDRAAGRRLCFLSPAVATPAAPRLYQAIGYEPVADADELELVGPDRASRAGSRRGVRRSGGR